MEIIKIMYMNLKKVLDKFSKLCIIAIAFSGIV